MTMRYTGKVRMTIPGNARRGTGDRVKANIPCDKFAAAFRVPHTDWLGWEGDYPVRGATIVWENVSYTVTEIRPRPEYLILDVVPTQ